MDLMAVSGGFASIVGLLCNFGAERSGSKSIEFQEFMEWLSVSNHQEIRLLIENNAKISIGIKALLNQRHEILMERLGKLDDVVSSIASKMSGFAEIVDGLNACGILSEQAVSILRQCKTKGCGKFLEAKALGRGPILLMLDVGGSVDYCEERFLDDDLLTLVELNLLRLDRNGKGDRVFVFTRNAERYLSLLSES